MVSGRKLGEDSASKNDWRAQALLCRGAFFIPRVRALPGRESRMPAEVAAIRPAVAGTRGMNPSWGGKDRRASARSSGRSICVNWHAALSSHSPSPDRVPVPRPARGAPFTTHRHTIAASTATRSATPPFMGTADGADKTFSSHPAEIADRARRVRLPAILSCCRPLAAALAAAS